MNKTDELPCLTRALRAFSGLSAPVKASKDVSDSYFHQLQTRRGISKRGLTWFQLKNVVKSLNASPSIGADVQSYREEISTLLGNECKPETIDETAVYLFEFCAGKKFLTQAQLAELKEKFGLLDTTKANLILKQINKLTNSVSSDEIFAAISKEAETSSDNEVSSQFGQKLKVEYVPFAVPGEVECLAVWPSEKESSKDVSLNFHLPQAAASSDKTGKKFDRKWLEEQLRVFYGTEEPMGLPHSEFAFTLMELLASGKSDDELQAELFDLMGFERFELIQILLQNRPAISQSYQASLLKKSVKAAARQMAPEGPAHAQQVIIQSEQEKQLRKAVRKEAKKVWNSMGEQDDEEEEEALANYRRQQAALATASSMPVLHRAAPQQIHYPNVYDSFAAVKQSAALVGGVKMALPVNLQRINERMFEKIIIPAPDRNQAPVNTPLVPVSSLDEMGQAAFQGCKSLNRIQSIVFETAYNTNENLLICAPTGAGKTNIAMLTVLYTLRQYVQNGVLQTDKFKIVYVAPMKALAAEMTANFSKHLAPLGVVVRELTGDMQLTKAEILHTQILVTTPEKWDVVTRKSTGDVALVQLVKLLIIDEVHLLHGDRGPVVEALVARTQRQVESSQSMIRIVGLSATLPNYVDVAQFLRVNLYKGLFFFDSRFRPVPLGQTFIGVKAVNPGQQIQDSDQVCYDEVVDMVMKGHQVMVFVHARNATLRTATVLRELAKKKGQITLFRPEESGALGLAVQQLAKSRNKHLGDLFGDGFSVHHAGMLRHDRNTVEKLFGDGLVKVLVCTATLAWGVNLPAHAVVIKGTEIYDASHGTFVDLGILDVLQIFGRAGRPQFDTSGHGTIITSHDKLAHYLSLLTSQYPIESNFTKFLTDNLNAEVASGTVTTVEEAVRWLGYTYLHVRMRKNPQAYGIKYQQLQEDPMLDEVHRELIVTAARALDKARMIRFDEKTSQLHATDLGRTSSDFYIKYDTVEIFNELLRPVMNEAEILAMISQAQEFQQLKVRDDEMDELDDLVNYNCELPVAGGVENVHGKVNALLQTHISRGRVSSFSLISDQAYVSQNAVRIARALYDIVLRRGWPLMAGRVLRVGKMLERQQWDSQHPLRQFTYLGPEIMDKIEKNRALSLPRMREMDSKEIGLLVHHQRMGPTLRRCAEEFPMLTIEANVQPITRTVLRVHVTITADFKWNDKVHGGGEPFWLWVEDPDSDRMYHQESLLITKKIVTRQEALPLVFTIPIFEPLPTQYYIRITSDRWLQSEHTCALSFQHLILPDDHPPHTNLLDLRPLPVTALGPRFSKLYNFSHFNAIQTQLFHCLYHTDNNVLLGAPTGSGKTIVAEIAMFRLFNQNPNVKVVYIAPLKSLVRERMRDWQARLGGMLGLKVVELTGDVAPDARMLSQADLMVCTPEKWDGVSRSWQNRPYVRSVGLIIIDEIHLLGEDRGPVLEVIVSRANYMASAGATGQQQVRLMGLSTAVANARDLANWLNIGPMGLYNFRPSVRPVPLEVHIQGFPGKHYCPRMATMNRPAFLAIQQYAPDKPSLIFVSSRRQTRLTALDLMGCLAGQDNPRMWLHMDELELEHVLAGIRDSNLKMTLSFGIGLHHAGLNERDRDVVEELYVHGKIQVLVATATVAWGVNFPAHLVIIKGTEYFDAKVKRYVDMPITDVLQMMGRAGRPQYDDHGVAVVYVHDIKKHFYKKFLYEPFPVESSLLEVLPDHMNAEVVGGTINNRQDALDYLTWTYFFRRLLKNPTYYGLEGIEPSTVNKYLSSLVDSSLSKLAEASCLTVTEEGEISCTSLGRIASFYYLSHQTMQLFRNGIQASSSLEDLLTLLTDSYEYDQLPVRHNEDQMNAELAQRCPIQLNPLSMDSSHTKAHLLLQCHFSRIPLPIADYLTDTKTVLDSVFRILQAMLDISAEQGFLATALRVIQLMQMVVQARWITDPALLILPFIESWHITSLKRTLYPGTLATPLLPHIMQTCRNNYRGFAEALRSDLEENQIEQAHQVLCGLPVIHTTLQLIGPDPDGSLAEDLPSRPVSAGKDFKPHNADNWLRVLSDQEYTLHVVLEREGQDQSGARGGVKPKRPPPGMEASRSRPSNAREQQKRVHAPKFPKVKDESWVLILGCVETKELLALKRIPPIGNRTTHALLFNTPSGRGRTMLNLYLMSDSYMGLDQQYLIPLQMD